MKPAVKIPALALVCALALSACGQNDAAETQEVLQALAGTAALSDYAVVADTVMAMKAETGQDGLSMTQRMWRAGGDAMQKMNAYDKNGDAVFENGAAFVDGIYYWYDGHAWEPDLTGMAAAADLHWMPKVIWPEQEDQVLVTRQGQVYTVEIRPAAFEDIAASQVTQLEEEEQALRAAGLTDAADARAEEAEYARQAQYKALRYTVEVENGLAVACTSYSCVDQPAAMDLKGAGAAAGEMVTTEITYTWRLTGTDAQSIREVIAEAAL